MEGSRRRRSRKRGRRKARVIKELPPDIVAFNILPRLPAKAICRFKCVSKQWHAFVKDPMFANMHLQHQNQDKLLIISTETPYNFRTIDCEAPDDRLTISRSLPFDVAGNKDINILTSFNGLVCVGVIENWYLNKYSDLILWNPLTSDYKTLSKTNSHDECYHITYERPCLLYHNSIEDDYKLLCVTMSPYVYIYSLKSDSWRKVESTEELHRVADYMKPCASTLDDKLYFFKRANVNIYPKISFMRFDLNTEKFTEISGPFLKEYNKYHSFMVISSCIHVWKISFLYGGETNIELWKMDGDWTKVATYKDHIWPVEPLHLMKNGKWLMLRKGNLCTVDPEKHFILSSYTFENMKVLSRGKYIETFVSPTQYIK